MSHGHSVATVGFAVMIILVEGLQKIRTFLLHQD